MSEWRRSSSCDSSACVAVLFVDGPNGGVLVRDSAGPPAISFRKAAWIAFVEGVKRGEFDWPEAVVGDG